MDIEDIILEKSCDWCDGSDKDVCSWCDSTGYRPTPLGTKILKLMKHNFKPMIKEVLIELLQVDVSRIK